MNHPLFRLFTSLAVLATGLMSASTHAQTSQVPPSFHGTYSLTFQTDLPQAPLPDGASTEIVLASDNTLCIADYLLTDPQLTSSDPLEMVWTAEDAGVQLALSGSTIDVLALDGTFLGQLTGSKTGDSTACGSLGEVPPNMDQIDTVFSLAEQAFPDLFPTIASENSLRVLDGFIYRHYAPSGVYVGINDDTVYLMGGPFGEQPENVGSVTAVLDQLHIELGMEPPIDAPEGDFSLTVSGNASGTVAGAPFEQQFNPLFTIDSIGSPDTNDLQAMEDQLITQLQDSMQELDADAISNVVLSDVEVSENRVFFNITFDADIADPPMSLSYDLDYEYLRN